MAQKKTKKTIAQMLTTPLATAIDVLHDFATSRFEHDLDRASPEDRADLFATLDEMADAIASARQRLEMGPGIVNASGAAERMAVSA